MTATETPAARRLAVNVMLQGGADLVGKVSTFVLYAVMAREAGVAAFGDFTSASSLAVLILISAVGADFRVTRLVAVGDDDAATAYWSALLLKLSLGLLLFGAAVAVAALGPYDDRVAVATVLLGAATIVDVATMTPHAVFRGFERLGPVATALVWYRVVLAAAGVALLVETGSIELVSGLWLVCAVGAAVYSFHRLRRAGFRPPPRVTRESLRAIATESAGLGVAMVLGAMLSRIDVVILGMFEDSKSVALYGGAYRLVEGVQLLIGALSIVTFPVLSRLTDTTVPTIGEAAALVLKAMLLVCAPVAIVLTVYATPLMEGVFGEAFADGRDVLVLLGPVVVASGVTSVAGYLLTAQQQQRPIVVALGGATVVNVAMNLVLIPPYGVEGCALAMLITMVVMVALYARPTARILRGQSLARVAASAALASITMAIVAIALEQSGPSVLAAGAAFVLIAAVAERIWFPADFDEARTAVRRTPDR